MNRNLQSKFFYIIIFFTIGRSNHSTDPGLGGHELFTFTLFSNFEVVLNEKKCVKIRSLLPLFVFPSLLKRVQTQKFSTNPHFNPTYGIVVMISIILAHLALLATVFFFLIIIRAIIAKDEEERER